MYVKTTAKTFYYSSGLAFCNSTECTIQLCTVWKGVCSVQNQLPGHITLCPSYSSLENIKKLFSICSQHEVHDFTDFCRNFCSKYYSIFFNNVNDKTNALDLLAVTIKSHDTSNFSGMILLFLDKLYNTLRSIHHLGHHSAFVNIDNFGNFSRSLLDSFFTCPADSNFIFFYVPTSLVHMYHKTVFTT